MPSVCQIVDANQRLSEDLFISKDGSSTYVGVIRVGHQRFTLCPCFVEQARRDAGLVRHR